MKARARPCMLRPSWYTCFSSPCHEFRILGSPRSPRSKPPHGGASVRSLSGAPLGPRRLYESSLNGGGWITTSRTRGRSQKCKRLPARLSMKMRGQIKPSGRRKLRQVASRPQLRRTSAAARASASSERRVDSSYHKLRV